MQQLSGSQEIADLFASTVKILSDDIARLIMETGRLEMSAKEIMLGLDSMRKIDKDNEEKVQDLLKMNVDVEAKVYQLKSASTSDASILDDNAMTTFLFSYSQDERGTMILSSKCIRRFRTSVFGYEFSLRAAFAADTEKMYLSLGLTLCNSEYANLLPFPFRYYLYVVLWDQSNQHKHIVHKLEPEARKSAFQRPISDKNEEYVITKFCPLATLTDARTIYASNQTFFIRIFVDFLHTNQTPFEIIDDKPHLLSQLKPMDLGDEYAAVEWCSFPPKQIF